MHSKMTMCVTSTMTSIVTKTAKTSKWLRLMYSMHVHRTCILKKSRAGNNGARRMDLHVHT